MLRCRIKMQKLAYTLRGLLRLTKPLHIVPADQRTPYVEKRLVHIGSSFVADLQPPVVIEPYDSVRSVT
jgi:hypothetical protein